MDLAVLIGIIMAWLCVIAALLMEGNSLKSFVSISSLILVVGGTMGTTLIGFSLKEGLSSFKAFVETLLPKKPQWEETITLFISLANLARREGILNLQNKIDEQKNELIKTGLQLIVDGADTEILTQVMETKTLILEKKNQFGEKFFETMGGFSPTLGIVGTVMGLVHVLGNLSEPEKLAEGIANAFIATFYGIAFANLIYLPVATKIKKNNEDKSLFCEMIMVGLRSIQEGDNPYLVEEKLRAFYPRTGSAPVPPPEEGREEEDGSAEVEEDEVPVAV